MRFTVVARGASLLPALACFLLVAKGIFPGNVLVPAKLLTHTHPWRSQSVPEWNVLAFDGLVQFIPWRMEVARQWREGKIPIDNPWTFAPDGGAPLLANGQSAVWYPPNALGAILGAEAVPIVAGWLVLFHLMLLAYGTCRFADSLGCTRVGSLVSAVGICLSACVVSWTSLPTHLATVAWLPWLLWAIQRHNPIQSGLFAAMSVLAGHVQIASYVLAVGIAYSLFGRPDGRPRIAMGVIGLTAFLAVALPQLLPVLELGRLGHRGGVAATEPGYQAYVANAIPWHHLVTWIFPDFYGSPSAPGGEWLLGASGLANHYAEWALYLGVPCIWLAIVACLVPSRDLEPNTRRFRLVALGCLGIALLLAFGTPLNRLTYFGIPGFAATGNPGRCMVVGAFLIALLAGIGASHLSRRRVLISGAVIVFTCLLAGSAGWNNASRFGLEPEARLAITFASVLAGGFWFAAAFATLLIATGGNPKRASFAAAGLPVVLAAELLVWGIPVVPAAAVTDVFPETPGIAWLRRNAGRAIIAPINRGWSLNGEGPGAANPVLVPNSLLRWRLRDAGGYDSLILRATKDRIRDVGGAEPSPPENGNMVFIRDLGVAERLGAQFAVLPPGSSTGNSSWTEVYNGSDCTVVQHAIPTSPTVVARSWTTTAVRIALFTVAVDAGLLLMLAVWKSRLAQRPDWK